LLTGSNVATFNFKAIAAQTGHGVMGVLGMDVLRHYCIQLDFTADRMRFLDDEHADKKNWGKAFPLHKTYWMPLVDENLVGVKGTGSLVDTGFNGDGWLTPKLHRQWTNHAQSPTNGEARSPDGVLGGEVYSYVDLDEISEQAVPKTETNTPLNGIGLEILAQNIVTFDFPKDVMYFKRTSEIPLPPKALQAAINSMGKTGFDFLHRLSEKGRLPGFSKSEHWSVKATFRIYPPTSETVDVLKKGDSAIYHYELIRASEKGPWRLQKAWRIDRDGRNFEYPVP